MDGAACWTNSLGQLTAEVMAHDHGLVQLELRFIADEDDGDPWDFLEVFQLTTDGGRPSGKLVRLLRAWGHIGLDPRGIVLHQPKLTPGGLFRPVQYGYVGTQARP